MDDGTNLLEVQFLASQIVKESKRIIALVADITNVEEHEIEE
jgi:hypothetical protein